MNVNAGMSGKRMKMDGLEGFPKWLPFELSLKKDEYFGKLYRDTKVK